MCIDPLHFTHLLIHRRTCSVSRASGRTTSYLALYLPEFHISYYLNSHVVVDVTALVRAEAVTDEATRLPKARRAFRSKR